MSIWRHAGGKGFETMGHIGHMGLNVSIYSGLFLRGCDNGAERRRLQVG